VLLLLQNTPSHLLFPYMIIGAGLAIKHLCISLPIYLMQPEKLLSPTVRE